MTTPRATRPGRRRIDPDEVVRITLRLVDAEGLDAVTMRRVAGEIGVTAMSLYRHFETKDALLEAIGARIGTEIEERRRLRPLPTDADLWDRLRDRIRPPVEVLLDHHPDVTRLLQGYNAERSPGAFPPEVLDNLRRTREVLGAVGIVDAEAEQWLYLIRESAFMLANACRPERDAPDDSRGLGLLDRGVEMLIGAVRDRAAELATARST